MDLGPPVPDPNGSGFPHAASRHTTRNTGPSRTAAAIAVRRSILTLPTLSRQKSRCRRTARVAIFLRRFVSIHAGGDKDEDMSTIPSGSPPADQPPPPPPPPPPAPRSRSARPKDPAAKFTRAGALWSALIGGFLVLILLL